MSSRESASMTTRLLAVQDEAEFGQRGVERRPFADAATLPRKPSTFADNVRRRAAFAGSERYAHERSRVIVATVATGRRGAGRPATAAPPRAGRGPAQADQGALADEEAAVRRDEVGGEAEPAPVVGLVVVGLAAPCRPETPASCLCGCRPWSRPGPRGQVFGGRGPAFAARRAVSKPQLLRASRKPG